MAPDGGSPVSATRKPWGLTPQPDNVPEALRASTRWVCWRAEEKAGGKYDKVPINPRTGRNASTANPEDWGTRAEALDYWLEHPRCSGIGLVLTGNTDGLFAIDLDRCSRDDDRLALLVRVRGLYIERSPSGNGYRALGIGEAPEFTNHAAGVECYNGSTARFVTLTGHVVRAGSDDLQVPEGALDAFLEAYGPATKHERAPPTKQPMPPLPDESTCANAAFDGLLAAPAKFDSYLRNGTNPPPEYPSESEVCAAMFTALVAAGWSREDIYAFGLGTESVFDRYLRARRRNEKRARAALWDDISRAVAYARANRIAPPGPGDFAEGDDDEVGLRAKTLEDFHYYAPDNRCIYLPTGELWACVAVDRVIPVWPKKRNGDSMKPSQWLARERAVDQITWHPGRPQLQEGVAVRDGGYIHDGKTRVFNLYRPPVDMPGDATQARVWIEHLQRIYPETAAHITGWLAHRVQRPGEKINHALVLGGEQGIGKDALLEPVKNGVGPWNWSEINPGQMLGRFNGWAKAVIVRVSEARDLGDTDRFAFYDHSKTYIAAPPDVIRVDENHIREHAVFNVCGVIITSNHRTDGIYLAPDDRRHHVSWSDARRSDFPADYWPRYWGWLAQGGVGHVIAYLKSLDLRDFDPKAPPERTRAFQAIVQANHSPEDGDLSDILELLKSPLAVCLETISNAAHRAGRQDLVELLTDRRARRALPHKLERAGYEPVRNPDADDGLFKVEGRRRVVYGKRGLTLAEQVRAARAVRLT
ncbi:MAG: DUF5906 domain-containing protein [Gammaproteobacteria bacterium]